MPAAADPTFGCPHFPRCPGCPWVGRPYAAQLTSKHVRTLTALHATLPDLDPSCVAPVAPAPSVSGYRVQTKLMVGSSPRGVMLGLYAPGSHRILDVSGCPLHDPLLQRAIPAVRDALADVPLHGGSQTGVRYALLRASVAEQRVLVTLVTSRLPLPRAAPLARRLRTVMPLAGLLLNENTSAGNVILGGRTTSVWGEGQLRERYGSVTLAAGPTAFVQANTAMATQIYAAIAARALDAAIAARPLDAAIAACALDPPIATGGDGGARVLDLYCGVGGIALTLAPRARTVLGIEEVAPAIVAARSNAERNAATHVRFVAARVEDALADLDEAFDVVTLNPPRKGCGPAVIRRLIELAPPRLLYLSCHPDSFARDAADLIAGGFRVEKVEPFDLLPQTDHVELLGTFARS